MIETEQIKFIELLCSRLCHDLISPIGAINNGLEFLEQESDQNSRDAIQLISKSATQAADKLAYYRVALGTAGSGDLMQFNLVLDLIEKLGNGRNIEIEWFGVEAYATSNIGKLSGKLILNLTLVAFDVLPRGGHAKVTLSGDAVTPNIIISVSGDKCSLHNDVKSVLVSEIATDISNVRNILASHCKQLASICAQSIGFSEQHQNCIMFKVV
jgi:histidine phosphotransferase ChpT